MKRKILLTGATGFLGSFILNGLLEKGYFPVILARPSKDQSAYERISTVLKWFGKNIQDHPELKIFEGSLEEEKFGLSDNEFIYMSENTDELIHCASDTDFAEKNREKIEKTNVVSLENILSFAVNSRIGHFHYISTAYACGNGKKLCCEKLYDTAEFTNVYEETKNRAEHLVSGKCGSSDISYTIYRPSIVYGDSETGKSRKFNALYFPVKSIAYLKKVMMKDIGSRGGKRASQMGVSMNGNGKMTMPVRMKYIEGSLIDVIPVNYFTSVMLYIFEKKIDRGIFNITAEVPTNLRVLAQYTSKYLGIEGLQTVTGEIDEQNGLEKLLDSYIDLYMPYIEDMREFDRKNTLDIIPSDMKCPELTYDIFKKIMDYAVSVDWGRELD